MEARIQHDGLASDQAIPAYSDDAALKIRVAKLEKSRRRPSACRKQPQLVIMKDQKYNPRRLLKAKNIWTLSSRTLYQAMAESAAMTLKSA